jgi:hypothetical protein
MASITDLRDLLDDLLEQAERHTTRARNLLILVVSLTGWLACSSSCWWC